MDAKYESHLSPFLTVSRLLLYSARHQKPTGKVCTCVLACDCLERAVAAWEASRQVQTVSFKLGSEGRKTTGVVVQQPVSEIDQRARDIIAEINGVVVQQPASEIEQRARDIIADINGLQGGKTQSAQKVQLLRGPLKQVLDDLHCVKSEAFRYQHQRPGSRVGYITWSGREIHWIYLAKGRGCAQYLGVIDQEADKLRELVRIAMNDQLYEQVQAGTTSLTRARCMRRNG